MATVIASQAVISGTYSLTRQAIQLGYCPRLEVTHTSESEIGQIYMPWINWVLLAAVIGLVLGFGSSSNLAGAYGIAVTGTMAIDTVLAFVLVRRLWNWPLWVALPLLLIFLTIDLSFFSANAIKLLHGGWFPIVVGNSAVHAAGHLEARSRAVDGTAGAGGDPDRTVHPERHRASTNSCAWHLGVPDCRSRRRAARAAAQP